MDTVSDWVLVSFKTSKKKKKSKGVYFIIYSSLKILNKNLWSQHKSQLFFEKYMQNILSVS